VDPNAYPEGKGWGMNRFFDIMKKWPKVYNDSVAFHRHPNIMHNRQSIDLVETHV